MGTAWNLSCWRSGHKARSNPAASSGCAAVQRQRLFGIVQPARRAPASSMRDSSAMGRMSPSSRNCRFIAQPGQLAKTLKSCTASKPRLAQLGRRYSANSVDQRQRSGSSLLTIRRQRSGTPAMPSAGCLHRVEGSVSPFSPLAQLGQVGLLRQAGRASSMAMASLLRSNCDRTCAR